MMSRSGTVEVTRLGQHASCERCWVQPEAPALVSAAAGASTATGTARQEAQRCNPGRGGPASCL